MAVVQKSRWRPTRGLIVGTAITLVTGLVVTLAVTSSGYDAQETPRLETAVWVTKADSGQYARVNTDLDEIDTVRAVDDPSAVAQTGAVGVVLTHGSRQLWPIDAADPLDLKGDSTPTDTAPDATTDTETTAPTEDATNTAETSSEPSSNSTEAPPSDSATDAPSQPAQRAVSRNAPEGTSFVDSSGPFLGYLTVTGKVFLARMASDDGTSTDPALTTPVDPFGNTAHDGKDAPNYVATAIAVNSDGILVAYSAEENAVRRFNAATGDFVGGPMVLDSVPSATQDLQLSIIGSRWMLFDSKASQAWIEGRSGLVSLGLTSGALLQRSDPDATVAYIADGTGISAVDLGSGDVERVAQASGTPAVPVAVAGVTYAAWIDTTGGTMWSSVDGTRTIAVDAELLKTVQLPVPVIHSNGQRAVLNEEATGMLWTIPDGIAIPMAEWAIKEEQQAGTVKVDDVTEQEAPVALPDTFGVRSGSIARLPVLLNDSDPNKKDVLTVSSASLKDGLQNPGFGDLSLVSNQQEAAIRVRAKSGSTKFDYAVTDGSAVSSSVSVTLNVVPEGTNHKPEWCAVDGCVQPWPSPQIAAGGTITVPVLTGWVDPDGDPIVLSDAKKDNPNDKVTVVPLDDGRVAIRHLDQNASGSTIPITITVADDHGATATKTLQVTVATNAALDVAPVAVLGGPGQKLTVRVADHVTGGSGTFRLVDAIASASADALVVVPNVASGEIELSASKPGSYPLSYTVQDVNTHAEQTAVIRLTVVNSGGALTLPPMTAFVRENQDTTVDVLAAVQNTSDRVLIVSEASTNDPGLTVSVVGQQAVRVRGSTKDGEAGVVGTARVSVTDGNGAKVEGTITVFLVASSTGVGPIAVPDAVVARAGNLVDIPVIANDVSPKGERIIVSQDLLSSGADGELAFVAGDNLRYLAPTKPGTYAVEYTIYLEGDPSRKDSATVTVTVTATGSNLPPQPPILVGHVLSGQTVSIPVDSYGMDPDGDPVVLTAVAQPDAGRGVAQISGDGRSILYTAPENGVAGGQSTFSYTVRDPSGATADGTVRVGVLDATLSDPLPVTYSDYVSVQVNATEPVSVVPLENDSDPAQGVLTITKLEPNASKDSGEYKRLEGLIDSSTNLKDGTVQLRAGEVPGVQSYVYTIESSTSHSIAQGLIVVTVADGAVPSTPQVTDTTITVRNRSALATGVDVVAGHVRWPAGDAGTLAVKVWGSAASKYSVTGQKISGPMPTNGALVPFSLTGNDSAGNPVTSYGFLRIPALDDMRIQLLPGVQAVKVGEEKSVTFDVLSMLDVDAGDAVQVEPSTSYTVQRANSSCVPAGSGKATYTAGREEPWSDYCVIPVRISGQSQWTLIAVPIAVVPKEALAQLQSLAITVAPGEGTTTIDLYNSMTKWQGGRVGETSDLDYSTSYNGSAFKVQQSGTTVTVIANADARSGTHEQVTVSITSFGGQSTELTLIVGIAPDDAPRGATFTQKCTASQGQSCAFNLVGLKGEYDPLASAPRSGLTIASIGDATSVSCAVATVSIKSKTQAIASWPSGAKPVGGECIVPFMVADGQGRTGPGLATLEVDGYPQTPSSVTTYSYTPTSVTLNVDLGEAANAQPAVTKVVIMEGSSEAPSYTCSAATAQLYKCTVTGLVNGIPHTYTARAVNKVGASFDTTSLTTWSYQPPTISSVSAVPVYTPSKTTKDVATLKVTIASTDDTSAFRIPNALNGSGSNVARTGSPADIIVQVQPGSFHLSVVPISQYTPPTSTIGGTSKEGSASDGGTITAIGGPYFSPNTPNVSAPSNTSLTVTGVTLKANYAPTTDITYVAWKTSASEPSCTATSGGDYTVSGGVQSASSTISPLDAYQDYNVKVCGTNQYGVAESNTTTAFTGHDVDAPPGPYSYTVGPTPTMTSTAHYVQYDYGITSAPSVPDSAVSGFTTYYRINGSKTTTFALDANTNPGSITVQYCSDLHPSFCSDETDVTAAGAPTTVVVRIVSDQLECWQYADNDDVYVSSVGDGSAHVTLPVGNISNPATYQVKWPGSNGFGSLDDISYDRDRDSPCSIFP
jgi:large repetitive protein